MKTRLDNSRWYQSPLWMPGALGGMLGWLAFVFIASTAADASEVPFAPPHQIHFGGIDGVISVRPGDIDGDGDLDLVAVSPTEGSVLWFENEFGDGSLWTERCVDAAFPGAFTVEVADLDKDGDLDVVAGSVSSGVVAWWDDLLGAGCGTQHAVTTVAATLVRSVAIADVNSDGDLDIFTLSDAELRVTYNAGGGVFSSEMTISSPGEIVGGTSVFAANFDSDRGVDVVTAEKDWIEHPVSILLDGGRAAVAADLDSDGDPDLATAAFEGDFVAWWQNETIHRSALFGPSQVDIATAFDAPSAVTAGDVDGDGAIDIASVAENANELAWWRNDVANGSTWSKTAIGTFVGSEVLLGDVDLDGDLDVVAPTGTAGFEIHWWENDGADGSSWTQRLLQLGVSTEFNTLADIDGDGAMDLVANNVFVGDLIWLRNTRNIFEWTFFLVDDRGTDAIVVADLDGDGDQDIAGKLGSDPLVWWENTQVFGSEWGSQEIDSNDPLIIDEPHLAVGDLDQDGDVDVLAVDEQSGALYWWQNQLTAPEPWLRREIPGTLPGAREILAAVLDGDGDLDILGRGLGAGSILWWQNLGEGQFWQQETPISVGSPEAITAADLDDDGDLDTPAANCRRAWKPSRRRHRRSSP